MIDVIGHGGYFAASRLGSRAIWVQFPAGDVGPNGWFDFWEFGEFQPGAFVSAYFIAGKDGDELLIDRAVNDLAEYNDLAALHRDSWLLLHTDWLAPWVGLADNGPGPTDEPGYRVGNLAVGEHGRKFPVWWLIGIGGVIWATKNK